MTRWIVVLFLVPLTAHAEIVDVLCKRNRKDGTIVVAEIPVLSQGYHWTILQFDPGSSRDNTWTYGQCKAEKLPNR